MILVRYPDVDKVGDLVDAAVGAGANTLNAVRFSVKDLEKVKQQGIDQAVENARSQADKIAGKLGVEVVGVKSLNVELHGAGEPPIRLMEMKRANAPAGAGEFAPEVLPGEREYRVVANASFLVKNR